MSTTPHTNEDYYNILEIPNTSSQDEIREAYRKLSIKYHPSKNIKFNDKFIQLSLAFKNLFKEDITYTDEDGNKVTLTNDELFGRSNDNNDNSHDLPECKIN
jgi:preprotein translocase subunit Sec63